MPEFTGPKIQSHIFASYSIAAFKTMIMFRNVSKSNFSKFQLLSVANKKCWCSVASYL